MSSRERSVSRKGSLSKCQRCGIDEKVMLIQNMSQRLNLLGEMHQTEQRQRSRSKRSLSQSKQLQNLEKLSRKVQKVHNQLMLNEREREKLSKRADRLEKLIQQQSEYSSNVYPWQEEQLETYEPPMKNASRTVGTLNQTDLYDGSSMEELAEKFGQVLMLVGPQGIPDYQQKREQLVKIATKMRQKRHYQRVPNEYGI